MIALLQRVSRASVAVNQEVVGAIDHGLLVLLGVEKSDTEAKAERMVERVIGYRVFSDADGKMNLSLNDTGGGLLVVSQFTLVADTRKGTRPSFSSAAPPDLGRHLYEHFLDLSKRHITSVASGIFAADMQVSLVNDGPVTFSLSV